MPGKIGYCPAGLSGLIAPVIKDANKKVKAEVDKTETRSAKDKKNRDKIVASYKEARKKLRQELTPEQMEGLKESLRPSPTTWFNQTEHRVTLHPSDWKGEPAWQLRGMATAPGHQRRGLGRRVLEYLEADIRAEGAFRLLWCNARVPAVNFYWRMGWSATSDPFDIPTAGPHVRMVKRLGRDG